jgi:hypothetical protein
MYHLRVISLTLHNIDERMINECGAVGGMRIDVGNRSIWKPPTNATLSTTNPI